MITSLSQLKAGMLLDVKKKPCAADREPFVARKVFQVTGNLVACVSFKPDGTVDESRVVYTECRLSERN